MSLFPPSVEYALVDVPRSKGSKIFVVDAVNGNNSNSGLKWDQPLAGIDAAYALTTTLKNDVILLVGNGTSYTASTVITWANDFTHLIGLNSGGPEPRTRIKCSAALATTPFVTWSGDGCVVKNLSFWHETSNAAGLVNVLVSGSRNTFKGCQFAGGLGSGNAVTGARSLQIGAAGEGSGNTFKDCIIGVDTVATVDGQAGVEFVSGAMHTTFDDCQFITSTGGTTYAHVTAAAAAGVGRLNLFRRCMFINEGSGTLATAILLGAALPVSSYLILVDCWKYGATDWDHANNGTLCNGEYATSITGTNASNTLIKTSG
jgi:hypothetical protein